jgi:hypothetical protein
VFIDYPHLAAQVVSDLGGGIQVPLGVGDTRIVLYPGTKDEGFWVTMEPANFWFSVPID